MSSFEKELSKIIEERVTVLFEIERVLFTKRYNLSQKHFEIFAVQSISMIYAIWEGFIQKSFQFYINELNDLKIDFNEFNHKIIIFHMENSFNQLKSYPEKPKKKINFYTKLEEFFETKQHNLSLQINTESNVSLEVLNKLLDSFCLEIFKEHWGKYKHPDTNLKEALVGFLRYRNGVAHGGDISSEEKVTLLVYKKYQNLVTDLMYEILNKMSTGLKNRTYLEKK